MKKHWNPDLTPYQFNHNVATGRGNWGKPTNPSLQDGAWYINDSSQYCIKIPWKLAPDPTTGRPTEPEGQIILAHDTHHKVIDNIYPTCKSILDVGGYDGIWAWLFSAERKVVLDVCQEALERWAILHAEIVCEDARNLDKLFQPDEFDVVFLLDVLEHMRATSALKCIKAAEKIAKHQVIVATPDGYQPFDDWESILYPPGCLGSSADVPCAELMAHKSGWDKEFFEQRGYRVIVQPDLHADIGLGDGIIAFLDKG